LALSFFLSLSFLPRFLSSFSGSPESQQHHLRDQRDSPVGAKQTARPRVCVYTCSCVCVCVCVCVCARVVSVGVGVGVGVCVCVCLCKLVVVGSVCGHMWCLFVVFASLGIY